MPPEQRFSRRRAFPSEPDQSLLHPIVDISDPEEHHGPPWHQVRARVLAPPRRLPAGGFPAHVQRRYRAGQDVDFTRRCGAGTGEMRMSRLMRLAAGRKQDRVAFREGFTLQPATVMTCWARNV